MSLNVTNGGSARSYTPVLAVLMTALLHDSQINPLQLRECKRRPPAAVSDVITSRHAVFATATHRGSSGRHIKLFISNDHSSFFYNPFYFMGQDSAVGMATRYGVDGPGIESG